MKLKVCGIKYNPETVAKLQPDYLGFIFWESSPRHFNIEMPELNSDIRKVGVFVDASIDYILESIKKYELDGVQLHGNESPAYCKTIREVKLKRQVGEHKFEQSRFDIIKVFSIKDKFDFSLLRPFEEVCDYFLFDTKGKLPGGNGYSFDWSVLKNYPSTKPYFLSGGIGLNNSRQIEEFIKKPESKYCHAIDVNSRFEDKPGLKNIEDLKKFKKIVIDK